MKSQKHKKTENKKGLRVKYNKKKILLLLALGGAMGAIFVLAVNQLWVRSSKDENCMVCHVHPHAEQSWRLSSHYNSKSGTKVGCVDCHLPPKGSLKYAWAKTTTGLRDVWSFITKDPEKIDWESKKTFEHARKFVYNESCVACHVQLFPSRISDDGITAHLYYEANAEKLNLQCISCHLDVGHFNPDYTHARMTGIPVAEAQGEIQTEAAVVTEFADFTEQVPGTRITFEMKAIPGGSFTIGSPDKEPFRRDDESPTKNITISPFFMGETEVTWDQYWAFYAETMAEGRIMPEEVMAHNARPDIEVDAISGPTPPFGNPDQGWGAGSRPAITMTHYAAEIYCKWLSLKTGKTYRLPTEAEWEYAARAGTQTPYFFEGNPKKFSELGFLRSIFKPDTAVINSYVIFRLNSNNRTHPPSRVRSNPFGLRNMLGNVLEYCSDWYAEDAYSLLTDGEVDPQGPETGTERVVRGGNYADDASQVRSATRGYTRHDEWLRTDPQQPKSIWWYADIKGIGFRVVCDATNSATGTPAE